MVLDDEILGALLLRHLTSKRRPQGGTESPSGSTPAPGNSGVLAEYSEFLQRDRGLARGTRLMLLRWAERLGRFLELTGSADLGELTIKRVDQFIAAYAPFLARRTLSCLTTSIRSFLRFLALSGHHENDLSKLVLVPKVWSLSGLPRFLTQKEVKRLLGSFSNANPADIRARAIVEMMLSHGLRASEVAMLRLGDVDWTSRTLRAYRSKTGDEIMLPLAHEASLCLMRYLDEIRPPIPEPDTIFLTLQVPMRPLTTKRIHRIVETCLMRAGLKRPGLAAHSLRHTFAKQLYESGVPLETIQSLLGHRRIDSTRIYVKVGLNQLREVAENDARFVV